MLNRKLLIAALAKKRAEVDILRSEAEHAETLPTCPSGIDVPFRNYNVNGSLPTPLTPSIKRVQRPRPMYLQRTSSPYSRIDMSVDVCSDGNKMGYGEVEEGVDQLSPLSPTFGPRRGDYFSGTVSRRRSMPPGTPMLFSHEAPIGEVAEKRVLLSTVTERRIQWEAAWVEIERDLEAWVGRFEVGKELCGDERENGEVWEELVELRMEGECLREKLMVIRRDSKF
jgi:hypothetical protein